MFHSTLIKVATLNCVLVRQVVGTKCNNIVEFM